MKNIKEFIQNKLKESLYILGDLFEDNELAYYSSQCKNELQIRDKIAWRMHKALNKEYGNDNLYVVRREWAPEGSGREKVDLAVLEMNAAKEKVKCAIALIEFKAQSIARPEKWYVDEFEHDVKKMRGLKKSYSKCCANADMYFVFLERGQECESVKYKSILGYVYQGDKIVYHENSDYLSIIKKHWDGFKNAFPTENIEIHEPKAICIGEAFDCKQYVSPLLIGPLK